MTEATPPATPGPLDDDASVDALLGALVGLPDDAAAATWDDRTVAEVRARMERAEARLLRDGVRETVARAASVAAQARATRQLLRRDSRFGEVLARTAPLASAPAGGEPDTISTRLALLARHAVPGTRWAGVRTGHGTAVSDPAFAEVEERIAEAVGDGPSSVDWPDLTVDDCPDEVRAAGARLGVRSVLTVAVAGGLVVLAADEPRAFDPTSRALAARFAEHVDRGDPSARETRDAVGEATRVIARREGIATDEAFDVLLETARRTGRTVVQAAEGVEVGRGRGGRPVPPTPIGTPVEPAVLRRALACIEERADEDLGVTDIARAARIGVRGLQQVFRQYRDTTPLEYLRQVRLERAHSELEAADAVAGDTVAAVASRWRFGHAGRFSVAYRRRFGQSPSTTLRA